MHSLTLDISDLTLPDIPLSQYFRISRYMRFRFALLLQNQYATKQGQRQHRCIRQTYRIGRSDSEYIYRFSIKVLHQIKPIAISFDNLIESKREKCHAVCNRHNPRVRLFSIIFCPSNSSILAVRFVAASEYCRV